MIGFWLKSLVVCIDRIVVGIANSCCKRQWLYCIDYTVQANVYEPPSATIERSLELFATISEKRRSEIQTARSIAFGAMSVWMSCGPKFRGDEWHWREVRTSKLQTALLVSSKKTTKKNGRTKLGLTEDEFHILLDRLEKYEQQQQQRSSFISFSRFCLFLGEAVHRRFMEVPCV